MVGIFNVKRNILVVFETLFSTTVETLFGVEPVRSLIPLIAKLVNIKVHGLAVFLNLYGTLGNRFAESHISHARFFKDFLYGIKVCICHLKHHGGILSKQNLEQILLGKSVKAYIQSALGIGETHLKQTGYETACRNIMTRKCESVFLDCLNGIEGCAEIFGIFNLRSLASHRAKRLEERRTTELEFRFAEIYMQECGIFIVNYHRRCNISHITHLSSRRNNHCSRRNNLFSAGILLRKRKRIFSCGNIYLQVAAKITQSLYTFIQTRIFAFLRAAGPHPVCRKRNTVYALLERSKDYVCQCFGYGKSRACCRRNQTGLRSMTEGCGNSFTESVIERNHTAVGQRQLQFTHTLLSCNFSGYRAVHFIGKPIFASHSFEMKHRLEIVKQLGAVIWSILVMSFHSFVLHYSLW